MVPFSPDRSIRLFELAHSLVFHGLFGIVVASTLAIIPFKATYGISDILLYASCFIIGVLGALYMDKLSLKWGMD